jgi:hypothetical protein
MIFRPLLLLTFLSLVLLVGCGDGLSGNATGRNASDMKALHGELSQFVEAFTIYGDLHSDFKVRSEGSLKLAETLVVQIDELIETADPGSLLTQNELREMRGNITDDDGIKKSIQNLKIDRDEVMGNVLGSIKSDIEYYMTQSSEEPDRSLNLTTLEDRLSLLGLLNGQISQLETLYGDLSGIREDLPAIVLRQLPPINTMVMPHVFVGVAKVNGDFAPVGTKVTAWTDGYNAPVGTSDVVSNGLFTLIANQHGTILQSGQTSLRFRLGGKNTSQTRKWEEGGATGTVLLETIDTPVPTPSVTIAPPPSPPPPSLLPPTPFPVSPVPTLRLMSAVIAHGQGLPGTAAAPASVDYLQVQLAAATEVEQILFDPEDIIVTYLDDNNVAFFRAPGVIAANGTEAERIVVAAPQAAQDADIAACLALTNVWCYTNDGNPPNLLLDSGEVNEIFIFLDDLPDPLTANMLFMVEISIPRQPVVRFERRVPLSLSSVMNLP